MSKKTRRQRTIERTSQPGMQQGGNMMVIPQALLQAILMQQSPNKTTAGESMLPGAPLTPYQGITPKLGPRQFSYPSGYNIGRLSRSVQSDDQDVPSFWQLRNFARNYDGVQLCERAWLDMLMKLQLTIKPRPELIQDGDDENDLKYQKDIAKYLKFFEKPDGQKPLHDWLRTAIIEQVELDALGIYMRPTKGGDLFGMDVLDGATLKPLLDDRGRPPEPPYPAYQQYLYGGLPGALLTSQQLLYIRESPRADTPYGVSRVERIIMRVRQALRKQSKDLAYFTDGNIPPGLLQLPQTETEWTSDDVQTYQQMFDSLLAGNDQQRNRIRVVPPGTSYARLDEPLLATDFDKFLLNVTVASFGLSMADLGFTENVNRSSGDSQENMTYRRTMQPLMNLYASIFTQVLRDYFNENRFVVGWTGFEESEDLEMQSTAYSTLVTTGIISPSDAARAMHLPVHFEMGPIVITKDGPMLLEDFADPEFRAAQKAAQLAGFKLAANPQPPQAPKQEDPQNAPGMDDQNASSEDGKEETNSTAAQKVAQSVSRSAGLDSESEIDRSAISTEYRQWREVALKDVKQGKSIRQFFRVAIPEPEYEQVRLALQHCTTQDEVKAVFRGDHDFLALAAL